MTRSDRVLGPDVRRSTRALQDPWLRSYRVRYLACVASAETIDPDDRSDHIQGSDALRQGDARPARVGAVHLQLRRLEHERDAQRHQHRLAPAGCGWAGVDPRVLAS